MTKPDYFFIPISSCSYQDICNIICPTKFIGGLLMKKTFNFLKKSTFVTAMFLFITGSLILSGGDFGFGAENGVSTCAVGDPQPDQRPIGAGGADQD